MDVWGLTLFYCGFGIVPRYTNLRCLASDLLVIYFSVYISTYGVCFVKLSKNVKLFVRTGYVKRRLEDLNMKL